MSLNEDLFGLDTLEPADQAMPTMDYDDKELISVDTEGADQAYEA